LAKEIAMAVQISLAPLETGDHLDRAEFHQRYLASPRIKHAELVEGIVYVSSPLRLGAHAEPHADLVGWVQAYRAATYGIRVADNPTLILDARNELQPDIVLRIHEDCGGRSRQSPRDYLEGPPELIVEIAASSASYDLHDKRDVYARCGVQEYLVWRTRDGAIDWWGLEGGRYQALPRDAAGHIDSRVLPGLRLDVPALLAGDLAEVLATQQAQHGRPAHAAFVTRLAEIRDL
jgi:Uma2 family endonuclease